MAPRTTRDILVQTDRPEEAAHFYGTVLGFSCVHDDPAMRGFETGAFTLYLHPDPPLGPVLEILVADPEAEKARLLQAGCKLEREDPEIPRCYMRDPFGLLFNLRRG